MSTLNVSNITDGTDTVGTSYVLNGSAKAWGACNSAGSDRDMGKFNVSSVTDAGTNGKEFNLTNAFTSVPIYGIGPDGISNETNVNSFTDDATGCTSSVIKVRFYNASYTDGNGTFIAFGDLA
jgi:hypothetical protein